MSGGDQLMEYTIGEYKLHTGTILFIKHYGEEVEATFIGRNPNNVNRVVINVKGCRWFLTEKQLLDKLVSVTDRIDPKAHPPVIKQLKDSQIDGLFIGWLWYIFLMAIVTIFKGNVFLWILISIVFFDWRKGKIEKEGTYIEW